MLGAEELEKRFYAKTPTAESLEVHQAVRGAYLVWAAFLDEYLPDGRAKELAMTDLENSSMWAHKAIAQDDPINKKV